MRPAPVLAVVGAALALILGSAPIHGARAAGGREPPSHSSRPGPRTYRPPVSAPVVDGFRPPAKPWLAGNRGLAYGTAPGTLVRAIGPGTVTFAGPVAGTLHVTVTHPDGLRSSYSFLAVVRTRTGRTVAAGDVVGVAAAELHLGVRRGERYLDPATLWGHRVGGGRVVLVPTRPGWRLRGPGLWGRAPPVATLVRRPTAW